MGLPHKKSPNLGLYFADWTGLEPATSAVTGRHSNQLNYQSVRTFMFSILSNGTAKINFFLRNAIPEAKKLNYLPLAITNPKDTEPYKAGEK